MKGVRLCEFCDDVWVVEANDWSEVVEGCEVKLVGIFGGEFVITFDDTFDVGDKPNGYPLLLLVLLIFKGVDIRGDNGIDVELNGENGIFVCGDIVDVPINDDILQYTCTSISHNVYIISKYDNWNGIFGLVR